MDQELIRHLMGLDPVRSDPDMAYVPTPNRSDLVLTSIVPPLSVAPTAFLLPYLDDGSLVMATNRKRGVETPGGHRECGESLEQAAVRETFEETGCEVTDVQPIGFQRLVSDGAAPEGYRYPFPVSFQQFFVGRVTRMNAIEDNDEVLQPTVIRPEEAEARLNAIQYAFHRHAFEMLFGNRADPALQTP